MWCAGERNFFYYVVRCERFQFLRRTAWKGQMNLGIAVWCECCITEHQQEVQQAVCAEPSFRTGSTGQDIYHSVPNTLVYNDDLKIIY